MKYKDWLQIWLNHYVKLTTKARTFERYGYIVEKHLAVELGDYLLDELTPLILQKYITFLLEKGNCRTKKGLSENSVNGIITVIKATLKMAYGLGYCKENIGDKIRRPKGECKTVVCFTTMEQKKIEQDVMNEKKGKLFGIVFCLYTGLRIGELLALEWSAIDLKNSIVTVKKSCYDGKDENGEYKRFTSTPKTATSTREIPFPKQLLPLLKSLKRSGEGDFVVAGKDGKPISVRSYQRSFELLLKKLNIPHKGFHALRHTFATRALECGMDVKTLSEILGHKNPTVTLNRYVHSMMDYKRSMMNKLGKKMLENK